MQAYLGVKNDRESPFHHSVSPVKLVQGCLCARKDRERCLYLCGDLVKLVQVGFKCQERSRKPFSPLRRSCEAREGLFKC